MKNGHLRRRTGNFEVRKLHSLTELQQRKQGKFLVSLWCHIARGYIQCEKELISRFDRLTFASLNTKPSPVSPEIGDKYTLLLLVLLLLSLLFLFIIIIISYYYIILYKQSQVVGLPIDGLTYLKNIRV